jgi:hypothetical protein
MARNPELLTHIEWLGYLQPVGLVVSQPALADAQAFPSKNIIPEHNRFLEMVDQITLEGENDPQPSIRDFPHFATQMLGWEPADLLGSPGGEPVPEALEVALPEYNETLRPAYAVPEFDKTPDGDRKWLMLIQRVNLGLDLDDTPETDARDHRWQASPQARFERLLRETQVPIGLLSNGTHLRLVYAPRGETSGHLTFPVRAMTEVAGRPIFAALQMLLSAERLFTLPDKQRLPTILSESRKYQNLVSTKLAEQVLAALYELLRGFQAADDQRHGELLREVLKDDPNQVYAGLLRVLLRLVFILYAEDRSLLSDNEVYQKFYSVIGLFERLREDAGRYTDTMDHRFGAWAQLLTLFRLIYDGGRHGGLKLLPRKGYLFDPDRYPFLEGRPKGSMRQPGERTEPPRVSDGVVFRVLQNLLILDGERLSYRTLDVEQIGSVYETMMGFNLEVAQGRSIAIKPTKPHGAPATINLEELLAAKPADRAKWLKEKSDQAVTGQAAAALKEAATPEDAVAALERKVSFAATPRVVPAGAMVLQPSDERRRSGSHYTPRTLTEPIVVTTFRPILDRLGPNPTPEQILDLKVCDPAMGSGAFLVAVCRLLADLLVRAWHAHTAAPKDIPPDEDELLHARRIVAQRCLYGVDKNPMAVDLAKLSLWLATLAKDHPFTFLDHALKCGDSLVGLSKSQILGFHWKPEKQRDFARAAIEGRLGRALEQRLQIREAPDVTSEALLCERLTAADGFLDPGRRYGDLVVSAFFAADNDRKRKEWLESLLEDLAAQRSQFDVARHQRLEAAVGELRSGSHPVFPFHWEIEFPEVFGRQSPGFDAIVGNPPFMGGSKISSNLGSRYLDWVLTLHEQSHGNGDLVAHFFRRAFTLYSFQEFRAPPERLCPRQGGPAAPGWLCTSFLVSVLLRGKGCFGLIATNTIGQGDTRSTGLRWICTHGGTIYEATRRLKWPGLAAVVVSVVHVARGAVPGSYRLDRRDVPVITAYLFHAGGHDDPEKLKANERKSFAGVKIYGTGFTFDDNDTKELANPIALMHELIQKDPRNAERIFPYIGGEEVNDSPTHGHHRYVINFGEMGDEEARRWPDLMKILEEKVKPERHNLSKRSSWASGQADNWWLFERPRPELQKAILGLRRVLVCSQVSKFRTLSFLPADIVFDQRLIVFAFSNYSVMTVLHSQLHENWARFFGSTLEDRPVYTPSDCFETFPLPDNFETNSSLEAAGKAYYEFRASLMVRNNEGLTKTYNRFHDPDERSPDILKLRELHAAMDRAVLDAYGWTDLKRICEFLLDYEEDEDEDETGGTRRRKKPWRYRWPDEFRDEVLARLLELNRQRAEEERLSGAAESGWGKSTKKSTKGRKADTKKPDQPEFFES